MKPQKYGMLSYPNYNSKKFIKFNNNHKSQEPAEEEEQVPIPENLNSENDSDSDSELDDPMDIVFGITRNVTLQIPHGLTRGPIIYENNRSNFNSDQLVMM